MSLSTEGRWAGRLTNRPLPRCGDIAEEDRPLVSLAWHARGASERRVADSFTVIAGALERLQAPLDLRALARRAIDDEHRHAELCRRVASAYANRELADPDRLPLELPRHAGASQRLRDALFIVGQCCFNETFASVVLEAALARAEDPLARAALRELLSDEVDHARIGWWYLGSMTPSERRELEPWLPSLAKANIAMWVDSDRPTGGDASTAFGVLTPALVASAVNEGLRGLVIPGFLAAGLGGVASLS